MKNLVYYLDKPRGVFTPTEEAIAEPGPGVDLMTNASERFHHSQILEAIRRADDKDSLKVIINWDD